VQGWPSRPVRLLVPFAAGAGINDIMARLVGQHLGAGLGQPVVIENRAGAGGIAGTEAAAKAAPDGYTFLMTNVSLVTSAYLYPKLPYDPQKDFVPVTLVATSPLMLVVHPSVAAKSVQELVALAKAKPGELNFGSSGNGSPQHLGATMFQLLTGTRMNHVPYKGAAPAIADLLPGRIQVWIGAANTILPHVKDGRLRLLGDTPTIAQTVPGYSLDPWLGLFVPAKTPPEILMKIHGEVVKILNSPDLKGKLGPQGIELVTNSPAEFARFIREDNLKWGKLIKEAGIKAD